MLTLKVEGDVAGKGVWYRNLPNNKSFQNINIRRFINMCVSISDYTNTDKKSFFVFLPKRRKVVAVKIDDGEYVKDFASLLKQPVDITRDMTVTLLLKDVPDKEFLDIYGNY